MIAVLWRKSEAAFESQRLILLEEIGNTFKRTWRGDELFGFVSDRLEVLDLDDDGFGEIIFGATEKADRMLYVFFTDSLQIVGIRSANRVVTAAVSMGIAMEHETREPSDVAEARRALA